MKLKQGQENNLITRSYMDGGFRCVEGAFWFEMSAGSVLTVKEATESVDLEARDGHEKNTEINQVVSGTRIITGIASSTGVDSYGTEMSLAALEGMKAQFDGRVAYAPVHARREWNEVIGRTTGATINQVENVLEPSDPEEAAYILTVESEIYLNKPDGQELVRALERGDPIGQSIGGWFTKIRIHEKENGDIDRIIIDEVKLDHLAGTRSPSNGDSVGLTLREELQLTQNRDDTSKAPEAPGEPVHARSADEDTSTRHILSVQENDDTVVITYAKGDPVEGDNEDLAAEDAEDDRAVHDDDDDDDDDDETADPKRTIIPYQALSLAPADTPWMWDEHVQDGVLFAGESEDETRSENWELYGMAHTWADPSNLNARLGFKHPIARTIDGELVVVLRALDAVVIELNAGTDEFGIPDEDRQAVYDHVSKYYDRFGVEAPPLRDHQPDENPSAEDSADPLADLSANTKPSEARAEDPKKDQEFDMNEEALRALLAEMVGDKLDALGERVSAVEAKATPETHEPTPLEVLQAENDALKERGEQDQLLIGRLSPTRQTRAYQGSVHMGMEIADGDFSSAIEAARSEGSSPTLVHVSANSKALARIRDIEDNDDRALNYKPRHARKDLELGLRDLFSAAIRDNIMWVPDWSDPNIASQRTPRDAKMAERAILNIPTLGTALFQEQVDRVIRRCHKRATGVIATLDFKQGQGDAYHLNRSTPGPDAAWVDDTDPIDCDDTDCENDVYTKLSPPFKFLEACGIVSRHAVARGRSYVDILAMEMSGIVERITYTLEKSTFTGNFVANPKEFSGLWVLLNALAAPGQQVLVADGAVLNVTPASSTLGALTICLLDQGLDELKRGPEAIFASKAGRRLIRALLQAQQEFVNVTRVRAGFEVEAYFDAPIVVTDGIGDDLEVGLVGGNPTITALTGGGSTAIVFVNTDEVFYGELSALTVELIAKCSSRKQRFDGYWDGTLVLACPEGASMIIGIDPNC